jgi:hypothetical protein
MSWANEGNHAVTVIRTKSQMVILTASTRTHTVTTEVETLPLAVQHPKSKSR